MSFSWATIETGIQTWLLAATGLASTQFQWENTRTVEPVRPFIRVKRSGWRSETGIGAELLSAYDVTKPVGQEVQRTVVGRGKFSLDIQVMTSAVVGDAQRTVTSTSERTALDYMLDIQLSVNKPSVVDAFNALGIAYAESSDPRDLPEGKENTWASRAQMDMFFRTTRTLSDSIGYIAEVLGQTRLTDPGGHVTVTSFDWTI